MESHDQLSVIEALACLGDLKLNLLSQLMQRLQSRRIPAQQAVYSENGTSDCVYFIGSGRLATFRESSYTGQLSRGQMAGWDSFFHQCPRDHALVAQTDSFVYALSRADLDALVEEHPALLAGFLSASTPIPVTGSPKYTPVANRQVAVFTFEDLSQESDAVFNQLVTGMEGNERVTRYGCAEFCDLASLQNTPEALFGHVAADVFAQLEAERDTVLYSASVHESVDWYRRIFHQAETLVMVVRDTTDQIPDWFVALIKESRKKPGLVIVRNDLGAFDRRVLSLWQSFEPEWHYRLKLNDDRRWRSVARMARGQAINLILSGGGCLGAIHCGILKALDEAHFPIDTIGGTSAGGGIAISYASGDSVESVAAKFRYAFTEQKPFKSFTLPYHGLINPKRLDRVLQEMTEGRLLEQSFLPVHVTVTNLTRSSAEVLTTGPAWEATRMTGSLPGVLPPYIRSGCTYIDGGVMNNFPVSVAREKYGGRYVGITFKIPKDHQIKAKYEELPNALQATLTRLKIGEPNDFPGLGDILANSLMLSSASALKDAINRVDLLLHPPAPHDIGMTSFERFDELYAIGLEYGRKSIAELQQSEESGPFDDIKGQLIQIS